MDNGHTKNGNGSRPPVSAPAGVLGMLEWFRVGEHERVERALDDIRQLGIRHLRTGLYWADFHLPKTSEWYDWLLPKLAREVEILPCVVYTPPSLGLQPRTSSPPRNPKDYADFIDVLITSYGRHFDYIELWNEPNNLLDWNYHIDPEWRIYCDMIGKAAYWARQRGKKTVLGGMCPLDPNWLQLMGKRGVLGVADVVGVHGFPGTWELYWDGWSNVLQQTREIVSAFNPEARVWITEAGYSTWRHDEYHQVRHFLDALDAGAERMYWYHLHDLHPDLAHQQGFHEDERHYHLGIKCADGSPKLLFRLLAEGGLEKAREVVSWGRPEKRDPFGGLIPANGNGNGHHQPANGSAAVVRKRDAALICGGAGFIGTNVAAELLRQGRQVILFDNLSRPGVESNLRWLKKTFGSQVDVELGDMRDRYRLRTALHACDQVFNFAAQVAVTTSLVDPISDFEVNARGTVNLLEEIRRLDNRPSLLFTSTNKVYGDLEDLRLIDTGSRYEPADAALREDGISEARALNFHSPYGCSKGTADQYVLDYSRCFEVPAVVFRMSCIYGPHQFGTEDQGWVAHFLIRALEGRSITLYGDGKQVRDILYVEDLVRAMLLAHENISTLHGHAFNMGGGPGNAVSLHEVLDEIETLHGARPQVSYSAWRQGDQRYYVSDTSMFRAGTGWAPAVGAAEGIARLYYWLKESRAVPQKKREVAATPI